MRPSPHRLLRAALVLLVAGALSRPVAAADDSWFGHDKAAHFGLSTVLAAGSYGVGAAVWDERWQATLLGLGVALGMGGAKELADLAGLGQPSWKDFTWDAVGAVVGVGVAFAFDLALRGWAPGGLTVSGTF